MEDQPKPVEKVQKKAEPKKPKYEAPEMDPATFALQEPEHPIEAPKPAFVQPIPDHSHPFHWKEVIIAVCGSLIVNWGVLAVAMLVSRR